MRDLNRLAVTALGELIVDSRLLDDSLGIGGARTFDRGHVAPDIRQRDLARAYGLTVDMNGAEPAGRHSQIWSRSSRPHRAGTTKGDIIGKVGQMNLTVDSKGVRYGEPRLDAADL